MRAPTRVPAPPDQVWALLADPERRPEWMVELRAVDPGSAHVPLEAGDRFTGRATILAHDLLGASEVTVASPPVELSETVVIGARFTSRWTLSPSPDGQSTDVTHTLDVEFPAGPFSRLERWILRRRLDRIQRQGLTNLAHHHQFGRGDFGMPKSSRPNVEVDAAVDAVDPGEAADLPDGPGA